MDLFFWLFFYPNGSYKTLHTLLAFFAYQYIVAIIPSRYIKSFLILLFNNCCGSTDICSTSPLLMDTYGLSNLLLQRTMRGCIPSSTCHFVRV